MKTIHLLVVDAPAGRFETLVLAAKELGLRVGWLDLETLPQVPEALAEANRSGAYRSVAVTARGTLAAKSIGGGLLLKDLLREHFLGCSLVLVLGQASAALGKGALASIPRLSEHPRGWSIGVGGATIELSSAELAARLRRPAGTFLAT